MSRITHDIVPLPQPGLMKTRCYARPSVRELDCFAEFLHVLANLATGSEGNFLSARSRPAALGERASRRHASGATLVDLVITILIMGILAAAAAPRFASVVARLRAEAVAKWIAADLNYARRTAIQTSRKTTVTFRSSPAGYFMTGVEHPAHPDQSYTVDIADVDSSVVLAAFKFDGGAELTFNAYGRPLVGDRALTSGTVEITSGDQSFTVVVDPTTGEASVP